MSRQHWTQGGSGITNFSSYQFNLYLKAIRLSREDHLFIMTKPMAGNPYACPRDYSLHSTDEKLPGDLSTFWEIFRLLQTKEDQ